MSEDVNRYTCPISHEYMTEPVMLSDGTHYDMKSIVPWLLKRPISPLTNSPVSYRLIYADALRREIRQYLTTRGLPVPKTRLDTFFEDEVWTDWYSEAKMGKTEWREYLVLRRLYWLLKIRESEIPERERIYIQYNFPRDGLAAFFDELPDHLEPFRIRCPNAFTTKWVVVHFCDIDSLLYYMYRHTDVIREYLSELPIGPFRYYKFRIKIGYVDLKRWCVTKCIEHRVQLRSLLEWFLLAFWILFLVSAVFVVFCLVLAIGTAVVSFILTHHWFFSLVGYPCLFALTVCLIMFTLLFSTRHYS